MLWQEPVRPAPQDHRRWRDHAGSQPEELSSRVDGV